jgi:hypothetical protein
MGSSQWIDAIIEEEFKPCNLQDRAGTVVKSLLEKYSERLVNDALRRTVKRARALSRQEDKDVCEYLKTALDKDWITEFCESYANAMID